MEVSIGQDSREGMSEAVHEAARRIVLEYWVAHDCEEAHAEAVAHLNAVNVFTLPFFYSVSFEFIFNCFTS